MTFLRRLVTIRLNILFRSFSDIFTTIFPNVEHAYVAEIASGLVDRVFDKYFAEIAQLVERRTENPGVPSSILGLGTFFEGNALVLLRSRITSGSFAGHSKSFSGININENFAGAILFLG